MLRSIFRWLLVVISGSHLVYSPFSPFYWYSHFMYSCIWLRRDYRMDRWSDCCFPMVQLLGECCVCCGYMRYQQFARGFDSRRYALPSLLLVHRIALNEPTVGSTQFEISVKVPPNNVNLNIPEGVESLEWCTVIALRSRWSPRTQTNEPANWP